MNQDMIDKAYDLAREAKVNGQKYVVVFSPTQEWHHPLCRERHIYTRYSDTPSGLESSSVDTLIVVGRAKEFSKEGFDYIWDKMRGGSGTKVAFVPDDPPASLEIK